ncbi:hypothetical protein [Methylobacterium oxalidis]|uniref:hypothetical protein n=1 Tax=Methylobacterium oxalidis TaxID=944322 RepID=UPI0033162D29
MTHGAFRLLALALMGVLAGCGEQLGGIERFGLVAAPEDQALVASAIETAERVLAGRGGILLVPGWSRSSSRAAVSVHAVRRDGLGRLELVATYEECRCIIVNAAALTGWTRAVTGSGGSLLTVEPRSLLAYMLLHEAGHVVEDERTRHQPSPATAPASLNRDLTVQKEREQRADAFAAAAIRAALSESGTDRGLAAASMAMTLGQLSWNLAAHRLLDDFGGTALKKPALFWDRGFSHPNLEWRVLAVNALIADTDVARTLLQDFENARNDGSSGMPRLLRD